jgi:hypothetical protein
MCDIEGYTIFNKLKVFKKKKKRKGVKKKMKKSLLVGLVIFLAGVS